MFGSARAADEFVESYVCWREACEDVRMAYERWWSCRRLDRGLLFAVYRAALDREEHASRVHCASVERMGAALAGV
jgi:hypothetical protein